MRKDITIDTLMEGDEKINVSEEARTIVVGEL